jgi:hypothetical protein
VAAAKTACLIDAHAQAKDVDKASQLKALKAEKPQPYGGKSAWRASYVTITLDEYADFAARVTKCASTLGVAGRRRLQQDAADTAALAPAAAAAAAGAPPPAGSAEAPTTDAAPPAGSLAQFWAAAAARHAAAAASNDTGDQPPRAPSALTAGLLRRARGGGAAPAALSAAATATAAPATASSGCQGLVDWVAAKGDAPMRALAPMVRKHTAVAGGLIETLSPVAAAAGAAAADAVGPGRWNAYLDACTAALQRRYNSKQCSYGCVLATSAAADVVTAAGAATQKLQDQLRLLTGLAWDFVYAEADLKVALCRATDWRASLPGVLEDIVKGGGILDAKVGGARGGSAAAPLQPLPLSPCPPSRPSPLPSARPSPHRSALLAPPHPLPPAPRHHHRRHHPRRRARLRPGAPLRIQRSARDLL